MEIPDNCPFSAREWEVVRATFHEGRYHRSNIVGERLLLGSSTVRSHLSQARRKLKVLTNEDLYKKVIEQGWIGHRGGMKQRRDHAGYGQTENLSPALKAYLSAFDELLKNWRSKDIVDHSREQMRHHLAAEVIRQRLDPRLCRGPTRISKQGSLDQELSPAVLPGI